MKYKLLIAFALLGVLFLSGCEEEKFDSKIHNCLETECKPICKGILCPENPPAYCNINLPNDESDCQIGYCDSCVKWEKPKCYAGEIKIPPNLYMFVDNESRDWHPFHNRTYVIVKNCGDCGEKITLCDKVKGHLGNYTCLNVVYEGYFPCIEENSYTITEDMLEREEPKLKYYEYCHVSLYLITYVDEIWSKNCYAIKQETKFKGQYKQYVLNNSFKYAGSYWEFRDKLNEENKKEGYICQNPIHEGEAYCLKDNSTCLIIEENKICNLIKLKGVNEDEI